MNSKELLKSRIEKIYQKLKKPFCCFDIESTGLIMSSDEVIELYIMKYDGTTISEYDFRFNPTCEISPEALSKHGITKEDLVNEKIFADSIIEILDFIEGVEVVIGYNSNKFDIPFLSEKMFQINNIQDMGLNKRIFNFVKKETIDVIELYRELYPNRLDTVYQRLTGEELQDAHKASSDIFATIAILDILIDKVEDERVLESKSEFLDTGEFFIRKENAIYYAKGKHKNQLVDATNINYLKWLLSNSEISYSTKIIAQHCIAHLTKK